MSLIRTLDREKKKDTTNKNKNRKRSLADMDEQMTQLEEFKNHLPDINLFSEFDSSSSSNRKKKRRKTKHNKNNNAISTRSNRIPIDVLETTDNFDSFDEKIWLIEEKLIPGKKKGEQFQVLWGIYKKEKNIVNRIMYEDDDDVEDKEEGSIALLRFSARGSYGFVEKYDKNKWYRIRGGSMQIFQGKKNISLSSASKIDCLRKQPPAPPFDELLKNEHIIYSVEMIKSAHDKHIEMMSMVAWVRGFEQNANFLMVHLVDGHRRRISARHWNQKKIPDVPIGCKVLISKIKRMQHFRKIQISVQGPLFWFKAKKHKFGNIHNIHQYVEDVSTIKYKEEYYHAKTVTMKAIKSAMMNDSGVFAENAFYKCYNVCIRSVCSFFKITDKKGVELSEGWEKNTVIDGTTVKERKVKNSDTITYFINIQCQCRNTNIMTYMSGFTTLGKSLFREDAKEIYQKRSIMDITEVVNKKICGQTFTLLLSYKTSKTISKKRAYWTIQKLIPPQFDRDENDDDDEEADTDTSES